VLRVHCYVRALSENHRYRHASIDPATRAARGLPEDLIRLCVGIEDPTDLLDDLQRALLDAGAITLAAGANQRYVRASVAHEGHAISRAVEKLAFNDNASLGISQQRSKEDREWFVSAPGKSFCLVNMRLSMVW